MLVVRHGQLIFERYYGGYHAGMLNDLRSATKSFLSLLIGIAISKGHIPGVHTFVAEALQRYLPPRCSPQLSEITLRHLLTMTSGFRWITGRKLENRSYVICSAAAAGLLTLLACPLIMKILGNFNTAAATRI